jgi:hypothetical protein
MSSLSRDEAFNLLPHPIMDIRLTVRNNDK